MTRFSVVIPTYERRGLACSTIGALDRQTFRDFEVIAVVDGSTDGSAAALEDLETEFPLTVVTQANAGQAAARNAGAARAGGELLLFLDDDMRADPELLAVHDRSHRSGADVVMGDLPLDPESPRTLLSVGVGLWTEERRKRLTAAGTTIGLGDLLTGQISLPRATFEAMGGFDVSFTRNGLFGGEDLDLGYRLIKSGCKLVFEPGAISYQRYEVEPADYLRRSAETGRSDYELIAKHSELAEQVKPGPTFRTRRSRWILTPFLHLPSAFSAPLRRVAVEIDRSGRTGRLARDLFFSVRTLEYQRGRRAAEALDRRPGELTVLAYHSAADLSGDRILAQYGIAPEGIAAHLDDLSRRGHRFVGLDATHAFLAGNSDAVPEQAVLVTFDDAYADLVPGALDVLAARGIEAVVFVVSSQVGGSNEWDQRVGTTALPLLDLAGLEALVDAGWEIGSHTVSHPQLTKVDPTEVATEVADSAAQIENLGLRRPRALAYPHGAWNPAIAATVAEAGYTTAFTIDAGIVTPGEDPFALPRIEVLASDTPWALRMKIRTARWPEARRRRLFRMVGIRL